MITHIDLFSGIGGFSYAVDQVWQEAEHIFCDNDEFCRQVLKKHWPDSIIYGDIKRVTKNRIIAGTGWHETAADWDPEKPDVKMASAMLNIVPQEMKRQGMVKK